ncbi:MAG: adenine deaminase [Proteobacteria bacterium]|nr:adenine deaminase [Candidatus Enterousia onthequi]
MKSRYINVAKGLQDADLVIKNAKLVNVLSEEIYETDIAIAGEIICGLGNGYHGKQELNVRGAYVCPGFIDGHVHLESSMMLPREFARAVLPAGTTSVFTDPHEIANVMGIQGIEFMHKHSRNIGLDVNFMLPSCVPATPFENSGAGLGSRDLEKLMGQDWVYGLAEMMNYVGVVNNDKSVHEKLEMTQKYKKQIDGHAPMLTGKDLCAYVVSGIKSDHECTNVAEALEKMRLGQYIMIREGSAAKDLDALMPVLKKHNTRKCMFVTDDRHPMDLSGHINGMVQRAVRAGVSPIKAIQCASLNTAEYFGLHDLGAVAVGYRADMLVLDDLVSFKPKCVIKNGEIVAKNGKCLINLSSQKQNINTKSVKIAPLKLGDFAIPVQSSRVKTIQIINHQLVTKSVVSNVKVKNGLAESNVDNDTLKICVIERHHATGNIGKGFIKGLGLKSGAVASTVAHDSHNIIVIGTNDKDMLVAVRELVKSQGGKVVVKNGKVLAKLELPVAGLISNKNLNEVKKECSRLAAGVKKLGSGLEDVFMVMGFLALPVIPQLKITDKGLFDVGTFSFTSIEP